MKLNLAVVVVLGACGGGTGTTEYYAVGAKAYFASPDRCSILDNAAGTLVEVSDHYNSKDGKGVVFEAIKPGRATIACGDRKTAIMVAEVAKVELQELGDGMPSELGTYGPTICLIAFAKDGKQLELGTLIDGVDFQFSDHTSRVVDHGMGGAGSAACGAQQWTKKPGVATVTATWRGHIVKSAFKIEPKAI